MTLAYILAFAVLGSIASLVGGILLLLKGNLVQKTSLLFVSFAAGALLGAAFFDLLPEALAAAGIENVLFYALTGMIVFYLLEKLLIWRHCHENGVCDVHSFSYMILFGDGIHNFIDGIIIATSFLISIPLGVITSIAIIFHEIPQEIGDFAVMLYGGLEKKKVLAYNLLAALMTLVGALLTYYSFSFMQGFAIPLLAFASGTFIYIAAADLIPETHKETSRKSILIQISLLLAGLMLIWLATKSLSG